MWLVPSTPAAVVLVALIGGCGGNSGSVMPRDAWHGGPTRATDEAKESPMVTSGELGRHVGADVTVVGRVSDIPWQHLIGDVAGKRPEYFDLTDGGQIVVFVADRIACAGEVELRGRVFEVRGPPKRPAQPGETKVDDTYAELQLDVHAWRCR